MNWQQFRHLESRSRGLKPQNKKYLCVDKSTISDTLILDVCYACGNSSAGRALPCQGKGRGFESRFPLQNSKNPITLLHIRILVTFFIRGILSTKHIGKQPPYFHTSIFHKNERIMA